MQVWSARRTRSLSEQLRRGVDLEGLVAASGLPREPDHHVLSAAARTQIGPHRRSVRSAYRYALEFIESGPAVHYSVFSGDQALDTRLLEFIPQSGCTVLDRIDLPEENATLLALDLGGPVAAGDTRLFAYEDRRHDPATDPDLAEIAAGLGDSDGITQGERRPAAQLTMEIDFHPDALPALVERISWDNASAEPKIHGAVQLDAFRNVHLILQNARPGGHGFRWSW